MLLKENLSPKMYSYGNILPRIYLSYIFEFELVPFYFSLILGDSFMMSPPSHEVWGKGRENFFLKNSFHGAINFMGKIYSGIVLHFGTNDHNIPRGEKVHKMHFPVM